MFIASDSGYDNIAQNLFLPNNGIFSDEFAKEHPYLTMAGNLAGDALAMGAGTALWRMPKYRAAMQAENRAAQEAVANSWDDMINNGKRITIDGYKKPAAESSISWEDGLKVQPFQSELDWTPEGWFGKRPDGKWDAEDVAALNSHIPEYLEIERVAKANGTWLKMPDGSTWEGDPRSWVQLMSKDVQRHTPDVFWTGIRNHTVIDPEHDGVIWGTYGQGKFSAGKARTYTSSDERVLPMFTDYGPTYNIDAHGRGWSNLYPGTQIATDDVVRAAFDKGYKKVRIRNVVDTGPSGVPNESQYYTFGVRHPFTPQNDIILSQGQLRKSLLGNNGNFSRFSKNIYKGVIPFAYWVQQEKDEYFGKR